VDISNGEFIERCHAAYKDNEFLLPLFVQQNALATLAFHRDPEARGQYAVDVTEAMSLGDVVNPQGASSKHSRADKYGVPTGIIAALTVAKPVRATHAPGPPRHIDFPESLGLESGVKAQNRRLRTIFAKLGIQADRAIPSRADGFACDGLTNMLKARLFDDLITRGRDAVPDVAQWMKSYGLTCDDWRTLVVDLDYRPFDPPKSRVKTLPLAKRILPEVKAALTRALNASLPVTTASEPAPVTMVTKGRKRKAAPKPRARPPPPPALPRRPLIISALPLPGQTRVIYGYTRENMVCKVVLNQSLSATD